MNESWKYTKSAEDFAENYDMINGVIIENAQGHRYASVWNDTPVDISQMRVIEKKKEKKEEEPTTKKCPFCQSEISIKATRCPHCTSVLEEEA